MSFQRLNCPFLNENDQFSQRPFARFLLNLSNFYVTSGRLQIKKNVFIAKLDAHFIVKIVLNLTQYSKIELNKITNPFLSQNSKNRSFLCQTFHHAQRIFNDQIAIERQAHQ